MKIKQNKKIILLLIILLIITLSLFLIIAIVKNTKNKDDVLPIDFSNNDIESVENKIRQILDSENYINKIFSSDKFSDTKSYINSEKDLSCFKYIGGDADVYINIIRTVHDNPFKEIGYFKVDFNEEQEELFVCKPNCNVKEIALNDIKLKNDSTDERKTLIINNQEYTIFKNDENWKLSEPIVMCEDN